MQMFNQMIDYVMQFWDSRNSKFTYSSESGDAKKPHTFMFIGSTGMSVAYAAATMLSMVFHAYTCLFIYSMYAYSMYAYFVFSSWT